MEGLDINLGALGAFDTGMAVTSNNIANINTPEFDPSRLTLETGSGGHGVNIQDIYHLDRHGPLWPEIRWAENNDTGIMEPYIHFRQGSSTDLSTEMVSMVDYSAAFSINAAAIKAWDRTMGTIMDILV